MNARTDDDRIVPESAANRPRNDPAQGSADAPHGRRLADLFGSNRGRQSTCCDVGVGIAIRTSITGIFVYRRRHRKEFSEAFGHDLKEPRRTVEVFQCEFAEIAKLGSRWKLVVDEVARSTRNKHLLAFGSREILAAR
jgi:hypothetical protein